MRNFSAFKIIGAIGAERRAKGGALFHIISVNSMRSEGERDLVFHSVFRVSKFGVK